MTPTRFERIQAVLDRRQPDLTVLMESVNKSHNFSAILRNCDAVGVSDVHVVPPPDGLPLHHHASAGTAKWIEVHRHEDGPSAIGNLKAAGYRVVAADPGRDSTDFREIDYTVPTAILVGAELLGITGASLREADCRVRIPMAGMARSLNVSVATALILYEAERQRERSGLYRASRLDPERRAELLFRWMYPKLARRLRESGKPYPPLAEDGDLMG